MNATTHGIANPFAKPRNYESTQNARNNNREEGKLKCLNMYDVRLYDDSPACGMNWPPDLPEMYTYLRVSNAYGELQPKRGVVLSLARRVSHAYTSHDRTTWHSIY